MGSRKILTYVLNLKSKSKNSPIHTESKIVCLTWGIPFFGFLQVGKMQRYEGRGTKSMGRDFEIVVKFNSI